MRVMRHLLPAVMLFLAACGGDDPLPTQTPSVDAAFVGTWHLKRVNGDTLPYLMSQSAGSKTELSSGYFATSPSGTFLSQMSSSTTGPTAITIHIDADGGTFTVSGNTATFRFSRTGTTVNGTFNHDTLTVIENGLSLALTR
jgi:hypothetical protein